MLAIGEVGQQVFDRPLGMPQMASTEPKIGAGGAEFSRLLHEELRCLPDKYRAPLVLCYLEGKTHEEAAGELQWPTGFYRALHVLPTRKVWAPSGGNCPALRTP